MIQEEETAFALLLYFSSLQMFLDWMPSGEDFLFDHGASNESSGSKPQQQVSAKKAEPAKKTAPTTATEARKEHQQIHEEARTVL